MRPLTCATLDTVPGHVANGGSRAHPVAGVLRVTTTTTTYRCRYRQTPKYNASGTKLRRSCRGRGGQSTQTTLPIGHVSFVNEMINHGGRRRPGANTSRFPINFSSSSSSSSSSACCFHRFREPRTTAAGRRGALEKLHHTLFSSLRYRSELKLARDDGLRDASCVDALRHLTRPTP